MLLLVVQNCLFGLNEELKLSFHSFKISLREFLKEICNILTVCIDVVSFCLIPPFKCSTHDAVDFKIHLFTGYENSTMFDLTVIWLVFFSGYEDP